MELFNQCTSGLCLLHLIEGSREAIHQHRVSLGSVDRALQNLHHQLGRYDLAVLHVAVDEVGRSALGGHLVSKEISRGQVCVPVGRG